MSNGFVTFIAGVAVGAAIGYYLATEDKEQLMEDLKDSAGKIRDELEREMEKGRQVVNDIKTRVNDLINPSRS